MLSLKTIERNSDHALSEEDEEKSDYDTAAINLDDEQPDHDANSKKTMLVFRDLFYRETGTTCPKDSKISDFIKCTMVEN